MTRDTRTILERLEETKDSSQSSEDSALPQDHIEEKYFAPTQVEEAARNSLDFLAGLAMPTIFRYFFPPLYLSAWNWLLSYVFKERDFSQLALGLPRGFAKTTFIKLFILFVILFTKRKFILICARTEGKAVAIVSDICDFLDQPNIKRVFGDWNIGKEIDQQGKKVFGFRGRTISIVAATVETVRGLNLKHERPDIMLFDDIQDRADADSETVSKQIETDMIGTAMKAKSPHGCLFIFVGNMYPTKWSILRHLKSNPNWFKFIVGGITADGKSLWEDLQPITQLLKEYLNDLSMGRPEIFLAEVLNDENASVNNLVDISKLPKPELGNDPHQGNFIVIDPATDKPTADEVSIMYFEIHGGYPVCRELKEGHMSPGDTIREALIIALKRGCRVIGIEGNAYQSTLAYWFNFICTQQGIQGIIPVEVYSGVGSKNGRIIAMFRSLVAGEILIESQCLPAISSQITSFNPLKTKNTDGLLDCLHYAPKMIEIYGALIASSITLVEQNFGNHRVYSALENSPF